MYKKNLLNYPIWYPRIRLFSQVTPSSEWSIWRETLKQLYEVYMKFDEMVSKLDTKIRAFRPSWDEGAMMWKHGKVLVHNLPYWGGDIINKFLNGYVYVSEIEDIEADDWVLVQNKTCPPTK